MNLTIARIITLLIGLTGLWQGIPDALAKPQMAPGVVTALQQMKPASAACSAKKPKSTPFKIVAEIKPDLSCAMSADFLLRQLNAANHTVIDTRTASEFNQFHIANTMNIPVTELTKKSFLHEKRLILLGNGKAEQRLYRACKELKANGYPQTSVLWGGMPAWLASTNKVLGQAPGWAEAAQLTAADLWLESQFSANLVLVSAAQTNVLPYLKTSYRIADEQPKTIQAVLNQLPKTYQPAAVVLVGSKGADFQAIRETIKPIPLLFYTDTAEAFIDQQKIQSAVWAAHARGPKQAPGCGH